MWVSRKDFQELQNKVKTLNEELQRLSTLAYVVDNKEKGLVKEFTFYQNDKLYKIEAVEIISGRKDKED